MYMIYYTLPINLIVMMLLQKLFLYSYAIYTVSTILKESLNINRFDLWLKFSQLEQNVVK